MAQFSYWIAWTWLRMSAALIVFAAMICLIIAPFLFSQWLLQNTHPTSDFFANFGKIAGFCTFVSALWSNHYWPRILAAKRVRLPFRFMWANHASGSFGLAILSMLATVSLMHIYSDRSAGTISVSEFVQYVTTLTLLGLAYLTLNPWMYRNLTWLFGSRRYLFDRFFLTSDEIERYIHNRL
jgi:hypothetical protein